MSYSEKRPQPIEIETDFFDGASDGVKFGVAVTRHVGQLLLADEDEAAISLVRRAYVAGGIIEESEEAMNDLRKLDGRSERFVVMQRSKVGANVIATAKLVHGTPLPMAERFPEVFNLIDPETCLEMSQLTCCHPEKATREASFFALLRAIYGYSLSLRSDYLQELKHLPETQRIEEEIEHYLGVKPSNPPRADKGSLFGPISTIVGMTEDFVFERAADIGVKTLDLGGPLLVEEARDHQTKLFPVAFDLEEIRRVHHAGTNQLFDLYLEKIDFHSGLGWYGEGIIENLDYSPVNK